MAKRFGQVLGWSWRLCGVLLALRLTGILQTAASTVEHHPREASIAVGALSMLICAWIALFWRRGRQLMEPEMYRPLAVLWVPIRTLMEALALAFFAVGLAVVLLQLFGGEAVQASMMQVSLAHHLTTEHTGWSVFANWILHSSALALVYGVGLRINDALSGATGGQAPKSPRLP